MTPFSSFGASNSGSHILTGKYASPPPPPSSEWGSGWTEANPQWREQKAQGRLKQPHASAARPSCFPSSLFSLASASEGRKVTFWFPRKHAAQPSVPAGHFPHALLRRFRAERLLADAAVSHVARTRREIVLRLNDRKKSMDKNVKQSGFSRRGLA